MQSAEAGNWQRLADPAYAQRLHPNKKVDLPALVQPGRCYHFRIAANPTVTRAGKRYGLLQEDEQQGWLARQGERCGVRVLEAVRGSSERLVVKQGRKGNRITVPAVRFDGVLEATDPDALRKALIGGIGHAKALGLGMLSIAPAGVQDCAIV